jgi:hypothetical protein
LTSFGDKMTGVLHFRRPLRKFDKSHNFVPGILGPRPLTKATPLMHPSIRRRTSRA